jgi:pimeloyl-ACP methyl ester carboxylesterase
LTAIISSVSLFEKFWYKVLRRPYKLHQSVDTGEGRPILLIHGLGTNGNTWNPLVKSINKAKWRLVGFDLLGFGRSPKPQNNSYTVNEHAKAIIASLDRSLKNQKIIIVGHSMGCLIASHIAWLRPGMVERLILYEPPLFADSPEFRSHKRRRKLYETLYEEFSKRPRLMLSYSKLTSRFAYAKALDFGRESWLPFERSLKNTILDQKAFDELKAIRVPTDIIYGKFDFIVTRSDVKEILQANKMIRFHLVNDIHYITNRSAQHIIKLLKPV